eukprot:RCo046885
MPSELPAKLTAHRPFALRPTGLKQAVVKALSCLQTRLRRGGSAEEHPEKRPFGGMRYPTTPPITFYPRGGCKAVAEGGGECGKAVAGIDFDEPVDSTIPSGVQGKKTSPASEEAPRRLYPNTPPTVVYPSGSSCFEDSLEPSEPSLGAQESPGLSEGSDDDGVEWEELSRSCC